jgi:alpha-beta hydrolase superfamily lysophospholipase
MAEEKPVVRDGSAAGAARAGEGGLALKRRLVIQSAAALLLSACAPTVQGALTPPLNFRGPHFDKDVFVSFDGAWLGLSVWPATIDGGVAFPDASSDLFVPQPPTLTEPWAVVIGLHGMNDYARTFEMAGPYWAARGVTTYAYDARGFGRSPNRGVWPGEKLMVEDLRTAVAVARKAHPGAVIAIVGESMGAAQAMLAAASDDPRKADRLILCSPAVWGWAAQPMAYSVALWTAAHTLPRKKVTPPRGLKITPSDNIEMLRALGRDKLMLFDTRFDAIYGLVDLMDDAAESAGSLHGSTLFMYGAKDEIIPKKAALAAAARLPPSARTALYPNNYHMMLRDLGAQVIWDDILAFLKDADSPLPSGAAPLIAVTKTLTTSR